MDEILSNELQMWMFGKWLIVFCCIAAWIQPGGSQFTLWFLKIKNFQKFSDHSEIFFCFTIHKKLNKSCSLKNFFCSWKKKLLVWKKIWKKKFVSEKKIVSLKKFLKKMLVAPTVEDFNSLWFWLLRGSPFTLW